jgi:hypothetical protein
MITKLCSSPRLFPITLAVLSIIASVRYFIGGDWKHGLYWLFAACLTTVVTL